VRCHPAVSLDECERVRGSWFYDATRQQLYVHCYDDGNPSKGEHGIEVGRQNDGVVRVVGSGATLQAPSGLWHFQWPARASDALAIMPGATDVIVRQFRAHDTALQISGTNGLIEDGLITHRWGRNTSTPTDDQAWVTGAQGGACFGRGQSRGNVFRRVHVRACFNGFNEGGASNRYEDCTLWGAPNHGFALSNGPTSTTLVRVLVGNTQESLWTESGTMGYTLDACIFTRGITGGVGTVQHHATIRRSLLRTINFGQQIPIGFLSDDNVFLTAPGRPLYSNWGSAAGDYATLDAVRAATGQELRSVVLPWEIEPALRPLNFDSVPYRGDDQ
jgi:hypothetical protein